MSVPWSEVLKNCVRCGGQTIQGGGRPVVTDGTPNGYLCVYCRPAYVSDSELPPHLPRPGIAPAAPGEGRPS